MNRTPARIRRALTLAVAALALLLAACDWGDPPQDPRPEVVIPDTTEILNTEARDSLVAFDDDGTLHFADPALAGRFEVGDVIVSEPTSAAPYGLLRRVLAVYQDGDSLLVETEQAALEDAIYRGGFQIRTGSIDEVRALSAGADRFESAALVLPVTLPLEIPNIVLADADDNPATTDDQLRADGHVDFELVFRLDGDIDFDAKFGWPPVEVSTMILTEFEIRQNANLTVSAGSAATYWDSYDLGTKSFPPVTVWIGPFPLVIVPQVKVTLYANGNVGAAVSFGASEQLAFTAGFHKSHGGGFSLIHDFQTPTASATAPTLDPKQIGASYNLQVGLDVRGALKFYGVAGPYLAVKPYLAFTGQIPGDPLWRLHGFVSGEVGLWVDLLKFYEFDWSTKVFEESFLIDQGSGDNPPEIQSFSATPYNSALGYQVAQPVTFNTVALDFEDGHILGGSYHSDVDGPLTLDANRRFAFITPGIRTVTVTVTDSGGHSVQDSLVLDVRNTPPAVTISQPTHLSTAYRGVPILLVGSATDPNEPDGVIPCYQMAWTSSAPGDVLPNSLCGGPVQITFATPGARTLTLTAYDKHGASGSALTTVVVDEPPAGNLPPQPTIVAPADGATFDDLDGLRVVGRAFDSDNSGLLYRWSITWAGGSAVIAEGVVTGTNVNGGALLEASWDPVPCRSEMTLTLELSDTDKVVDTSVDLACIPIPR